MKVGVFGNTQNCKKKDQQQRNPA